MAHGEARSPRDARPELAQILREHSREIQHLSSHEARVVRDVVSCRTSALGGRLQRCDHCGRESPLYNSCRNRHCPKCQSLDQALWVEAQIEDLIPVSYFHQVFTVPHGLIPFFRRDPTKAFALLFEAVAKTVVEVCRRHLGATPGLIVVLHTWNQQLGYHPHLHCIVTGGGLSLDESGWIPSKPRFFLPVRKLSKVFRGKLLEALDHGLTTGLLTLPKDAARLLLRRAATQEFVVYSKPPMTGPEQVLRYLGRYTHRIAISNERIVAHQNGRVSFHYKDRKDQGRRKTVTLVGSEFVRRWLRHVVAKGFVRVRHFGLLANGVKSRRLALARTLLDAPVPPAPLPTAPESWRDTYLRLVGKDPLLCPACHIGLLAVVADIPRLPHTRSP